MITSPGKFEEAIRFIEDKKPNPQKWNALEWAMRARDVREKSFFSAKVESVRFLQRGQNLIGSYLKRSTEQVTNAAGVESTALKIGSRGDFVKIMREFMIKEGMATDAQIRQTSQGDIRDINANSRLELIFDTNLKQARGFGYWQQGQRPSVLRAFPAARFIRNEEVEVPRPRHLEGEGEVRLKSDEAFWADYHNAEEIGGFGNPWPPFGFNSGMDQEDVNRRDAIALGLDVDNVQPITGRKLTDKMKVDTEKLDPELKATLLAELRAGRAKRAAKGTIRERARQAARDAIERGRRERGQPVEEYVLDDTEIRFEVPS